MRFRDEICPMTFHIENGCCSSSQIFCHVCFVSPYCESNCACWEQRGGSGDGVLDRVQHSGQRVEGHDGGEHCLAYPKMCVSTGSCHVALINPMS
jgi:hypothetical protein